MQRIQLTRNEKQLLRNINANLDYWPEGMSDQLISHSLASLESKGMVVVAWTSGMMPVATELTDYGKAYFDCNPHLHNPIDWKWIITTIIAIGTLIVAVIALLTACKAIQIQ